MNSVGDGVGEEEYQRWRWCECVRSLCGNVKKSCVYCQSDDKHDRISLQNVVTGLRTKAGIHPRSDTRTVFSSL